ncbi:MAG TPA: PliI family lysozyme inhibitor of I-type lysozyme [Robiginitalea sp.]|nr:PliI family lysozyme inhibitor of I-type lysozyme [Robiginitalea sp.]
MKASKTILLLLIAVLSFTACKNEERKAATEEQGLGEHQDTQHPLQAEPKMVFEKKVSLQNISFLIKATGEGSVNKLSIHPEGLEIDNQPISLELDGQVVDAEIEDLNSDGFPEVLIYTTSAGSGSYGSVIGYSVNNGKSVSPIYFPELTDNQKASIGYLGHDEFAVVETSLVRRFPIYKPGDTNSNPTGGTRQIQYKLKEGEASRVFVINSISEY